MMFSSNVFVNGALNLFMVLMSIFNVVMHGFYLEDPNTILAVGQGIWGVACFVFVVKVVPIKNWWIFLGLGKKMQLELEGIEYLERIKIPKWRVFVNEREDYILFLKSKDALAYRMVI